MPKDAADITDSAFHFHPDISFSSKEEPRAMMTPSY